MNIQVMDKVKNKEYSQEAGAEENGEGSYKVTGEKMNWIGTYYRVKIPVSLRAR